MIFYSCSYNEESVVQVSSSDVRIENIATRDFNTCFDIEEYNCVTTTFYGGESGSLNYLGSSCVLNYTYDVIHCVDINGNNTLIANSVLFTLGAGCQYYENLLVTYLQNGNVQAFEDLMNDMKASVEAAAQDNIILKFSVLLENCGGSSSGNLQMDFFTSNCYKWTYVYDIHGGIIISLLECNQEVCCKSVSRWCEDANGDPVITSGPRNISIGSCEERGCYNPCIK